MPKQVVCRNCGQERPHWARGFCRPCYYRWYRKANPPDTVSVLRERLEANREEAQMQIVDAINEILDKHDGHCSLRDGLLVLEVQGVVLGEVKLT